MARERRMSIHPTYDMVLEDEENEQSNDVIEIIKDARKVLANLTTTPASQSLNKHAPFDKVRILIILGCHHVTVSL